MLKNLVIGENVSSMTDYAFSGCTKLMNVISKVSMVFNLPKNAFSDLTFNNATLYILEGTTNKYSRINYWTKFLFMEEGDGPILSGIKSVENNQATENLGTRGHSLIRFEQRGDFLITFLLLLICL